MSTKYYTIPPPPSLATFVRCFWVFEHDITPGSSYVYRSMADGCPELVFHYKGRFDNISTDDSTGPLYNYSLIHAQSRHFRRFVTQESFGIFGVYLYPFAIPQLFACASTDVSNHMIGLDAFLGTAGIELEEQMMLAGSNEQRAQILSAFCRNSLIRTTALHR